MRFALSSRSLYRRPCMASECGPDRRYVLLTSPVYILAYAPNSVHKPESIGKPHHLWRKLRARQLVANRRCTFSVLVLTQRRRLGRVRLHWCQLERFGDTHQVSGRERLVLVDVCEAATCHPDIGLLRHTCDALPSMEQTCTRPKRKAHAPGRRRTLPLPYHPITSFL
jgi:hypothetical protein